MGGRAGIAGGVRRAERASGTLKPTTLPGGT